MKASALAARPELHTKLVAHVTELHHNSIVDRTALYECFLQTYLFAGFPAALEALKTLSRAWPDVSHLDPNQIAQDAAQLSQQYQDRGTLLYERIYSRNAEIVRTEMLRLSPELAAWAVVDGYGKTLSRPGLDMITRELCIVALLTQLGWHRQLFSHLMGARNVGGTLSDLREACSIGALGDSEKFSVAEKLIDRIS
ncbi:MAG: carboxymuconolactone decarboxylase family protein [Candidatus Kapaibacterium sp.]